MEFLGAKRSRRTRLRGRRDLRASEIAPNWQLRRSFARSLDACDRASAHATTGGKPNWNVDEITFAILEEERSLVTSPHAIRVRPRLREWIEQSAIELESGRSDSPPS